MFNDSSDHLVVMMIVVIVVCPSFQIYIYSNGADHVCNLIMNESLDCLPKIYNYMNVDHHLSAKLITIRDLSQNPYLMNQPEDIVREMEEK